MTEPQDSADSSRIRSAAGPWTLRRQLVAMLLVFTVGPLLLTNAWGYFQSRRYFERAELHNVHNIASLEANSVFRFVREKYQTTDAVVAGNQHLFGLLRALRVEDETARESVRDALKTHLVAKQRESGAIDEFYILSPTGQLTVSSLAMPSHPGDQHESSCFRRGRQVAAIDGIDWSGELPALLLSAPINDTSGEFLGIFCARATVQLGDGQARRVVGAGSPVALYLVDSAGHIIARDGEGPLLPNPGAVLAQPTPTHDFSDEPWEGQYESAHGHVVAAYAPVTELGWGILVETPVQAALANLDTLKWQAAIFAVFLTALVVLAALVVVGRIAHPLAALSAAATRAAQGARGVRVPLGGTVEVRDLARSFNLMCAAVQESHMLLEQRITERTHELQTSQEFSERLLNSIAEPVVIVDRALTVVKANEAALRRYGAELVGEPYHKHFESEVERCGTCPVCSTIASGRSFAAERAERHGESDDIMHVQTFPVMSPAGAVEAVIQLRRLVTDERRLQAQMVLQEKMSAFGIMAAGMAHEIGNPLAAVQSQLRLAREAPVPGRVEQTIDIVSQEVDRIARLLRELVSLARRRDEAAVLVAPGAVARDVVRLIRHDPRARDVEIDVIEGADVPPVRCKEDLLRQVLINLGLNAMDAMPEGGRLVFETTTVDGETHLRVRDTGRGVSDAARDHMFEPFFTTKAPGRGTGLGLFVSKGIITGLGGDIRVETSGPTGTVFLLTLPSAVGWQGSSS